MRLDVIDTAMTPHGMTVMGAQHPRDTDPDDPVGTLVLIGAARDMWAAFQGADEAHDGQANPLDRWSKRVIGGLAAATGAGCAFPSDGPPYPPFIGWALASKRFFLSPVGMMVHDTAGLMISIRGALMFDEVFDLPDASATSPCETCVAKPCRTACPVDALGGDAGYDVGVCKGYLRTPEGSACMGAGCQARLACPVSMGFDRPAAQSEFHMRAFLTS